MEPTSTRLRGFLRRPSPAELTEVGHREHLHLTADEAVMYAEALDGILGAVPTGLDRDGLPTSIQIVARRFEDHLAFQAGAVVEAAVGTFEPRALATAGATPSTKEQP